MTEPLKMKAGLEAAYQELLVQRESGYLNVPSLMGGVGIGKTEGAASLCTRLEEEMQDQIFFESIATGESGDPTDMMGVPWVIPYDNAQNEKDYKVLWALNRAAHKACEMPTMLFFDDIDKAQPLIVNALLKLFVERRFKDRKMHPGSVLMCAGNRASDDVAANELSESLKTRITIIQVEPSVPDFIEWATKDPEVKLIHPMILGWLPSKPELLHKHDPGVYRFPTPRGYREASLHMFKQTDDKWGPILERKIGDPAKNDFMAWFRIYRNIDVQFILDNGVLSGPVVGDPKTPPEVAKKLGEYASVFAVVEHLNRKISQNHRGLEKFIDGLSEELRVAFKLQLNKKANNDFQSFYPKASGQIMATIIKGA